MRPRRKKPRLFSFSREVELSHFEEWKASPEDRRLLENVVDAFLEICASKVVTRLTMAPLSLAARHPNPQLRGIAVTRLAVMCHYFPEAIDEMGELVTHTDESVRLFAASAIGNTPEGVLAPLVTRLLRDESWMVRKTAAQVGSAVVAPSLIGVLSRAGAAESDARVRVQLQLALDYQRGAAEKS